MASLPKVYPLNRVSIASQVIAIVYCQSIIIVYYKSLSIAIVYCLGLVPAIIYCLGLVPVHCQCLLLAISVYCQSTCGYEGPMVQIATRLGRETSGLKSNSHTHEFRAFVFLK